MKKYIITVICLMAAVGIFRLVAASPLQSIYDINWSEEQIMDAARNTVEESLRGRLSETVEGVKVLPDLVSIEKRKDCYYVYVPVEKQDGGMRTYTVKMTPAVID